MIVNFSVYLVLYTVLTTIAGYHYPKGILPCKFYETFKLDCSRRQLKDIPQVPLNITDLDLSHNQLWQFIPSKTNGKISVNLEKNYIRLIRTEEFDTSGYVNKQTAYYQWLPFCSPFIIRLQILILHCSGVKFLSPSTFKGLYNILNRDLSYIMFSTLPAGIFSDLTKRQSLSIKSFHLKNIASQVMTPLHALSYLHLDIKHFTSPILGKGFESLTNLSYLYLHISADSRNRGTRNRGILMYNRTFQHLQKSPLTSFELAIYSSINVTLQPGIFDPFKSLFSFTFDSEFDISKVKVDSSGSNLGAISPNLPLPNNKLTANALYAYKQL